MNRKFFAALACVSLIIPAFLVCGGTGSKTKDPIVKVGKVIIGKPAFEAFQKTVRIYPVPLPVNFPGQRQPATFMAEVEAIYQHANAKDAAKARALSEKIAGSLDWEWKIKYFTAAPFFELLQVNLGFTDAELEARYKKSPESFRVTLQTEDGRDTSFVPAFEAAKRSVADSLFLEKYPPDAEFLSRMEKGDGHDHDDSEITNHWLYGARSNPADFYMRRFFFERTGEVYTDSIQQIYGDDKFIVSDDIDIIRSWVPPNRRNMRMKELIEWLYKWKIFAEESEKRGLAAAGGVKDMLHWASRIEYAIAYTEEEILPTVRGEETEPAPADVNLSELFVHDQARRVEPLTTPRVQAEFDDIRRVRTNAGIDGAIYAIRKSVGIEWLQDEFRDERSADPAVLIARADSLRDAALENGDDETAQAEAETLYRTLINEFAFSAEGRRAMNEMAKIMLDGFIAGGMRQDRMLLAAISSYRRSQALETDMENLCNSMFMIGFTYDEHLKNYSLAEVNYKWILRNTPDCALAADAEFMIQHLGEPMTSIEEIRLRSLRQGRAIDFEDDDPPPAS